MSGRGGKEIEGGKLDRRKRAGTPTYADHLTENEVDVKHGEFTHVLTEYHRISAMIKDLVNGVRGKFNVVSKFIKNREKWINHLVFAQNAVDLQIEEYTLLVGYIDTFARYVQELPDDAQVPDTLIGRRIFYTKPQLQNTLLRYQDLTKQMSGMNEFRDFLISLNVESDPKKSREKLEECMRTWPKYSV
jgi:hypothetical protein